MLILKSLKEYLVTIKIKIKFVYLISFQNVAGENFACIDAMFLKGEFTKFLSNSGGDSRKKLKNIYCSICS